jgi:hypothetical protein
MLLQHFPQYVNLFHRGFICDVVIFYKTPSRLLLQLFVLY